MTQTGKNLATLGGLAILAAALGLYAWLGVMQPEADAEKQKAAEEKLVSFGADATEGAADAGDASIRFTRLEVHAKGETTRLERKDDGWRIVSPVEAEADSFAVDAMTSQLQTGRFDEIIEEAPTPQDLERYGLASPRFRITATAVAPGGGASKEVTIAAGIENTFDGSIYVQRGGDPKVYAVKGGWRWNLEKTTFDLRSKQVLSVPKKDVQRIEIVAGKSQWGLERGDGGNWKLAAPETRPADGQAVDALLAGLENHRATSFLEDTPQTRTSTGVDAPLVTATFTPKSGEAITLALGRARADAGEQVYVLRTSGGTTTLAEVPPSVLADLQKNPAEFRDKSVLTFDKQKVARIAFTQSDSRLVVERVQTDAGFSEEWRVVEPRTGPAKKWKLSSILYTLGSLKAKAGRDENPRSWSKWGLDRPTRTVELSDREGKVLAALAVGKSVDGATDVHFVRGTPNQVLELDTSRLSELPTTVEEVLDGVVPDAGVPNAGL